VSLEMALRGGRHLDRPPSLSGHCGHGPIFIPQRSVANDPQQTRGQKRQCSAATYHWLAERDLWDIPQATEGATASAHLDKNDVHLALFQTTSAVVPMDPAGLYHFSSSPESDVMIRLLSMPSKLGHELLSI
jgi:hypothetical protein